MKHDPFKQFTSVAANLAHQYHDVMNMVSQQSAFHLPANKSPRQALEGYLQACKVCGVKLHNDAWEAHAKGRVLAGSLRFTA